MKTVQLVRRARSGDREAWEVLYGRYVDTFLARYHGDLGTTVRRMGSTHDFVASAFREAMEGVGRLRDESAFFVWITTILRHKIAAARRLARRERGAPPPDGVAAAEGLAPEDLEAYEGVLDAIIAAFPSHPHEMAALVLRFLDGCDAAAVGERLGRPTSTIYRWLSRGVRLLRERLQP